MIMEIIPAEETGTPNSRYILGHADPRRESGRPRLIKDKSVLVIAHRMRTVSGADKVVVLSDGSVADQGMPGELMFACKIYPHLV